VKKSPIKRRARRLYKIWDKSRDDLGKETGPVDRKSATNRQAKFHFSEQERRAIGAELVVDPETAPSSLDESVDEIEVLVQLTLEAKAYQQDHPVSENLQQEFRALGKPIGKILAVLNASEFQHLTETVPNLRTELEMLRLLVEADQRKGRGRPRDPAIVLHQSLIAKLAEVWSRHHETWPKRRYRDDIGRDWGPFYRFLGTCLEPANIRVSDYAIREALSQGEK